MNNLRDSTNPLENPEVQDLSSPLLGGKESANMSKIVDVKSNYMSGDITSISDVMKAVPYGAFQRWLVIFHILMYLSNGLFVYNLQYFLQEPVYSCANAVVCTRE